ncbi:Fe-S cluster assembly protein SufD [Pyruvatibacter sp.]|uniref:Fe-S cluster assembly protein SufD n=1 Tax=Pyruvatibacter sp. TaxID=1981328 RepID=UPI0032ED9FED
MSRPAPTPLPIETGFVDAHASARLPGAAWLGELRTSAIRTFANDGLPHRRVEEYRYFDLRQMLAKSGALTLAQHGSAAAEVSDPAAQLFEAIDRHVAVFVNGRLDAAQSDLDGLPNGLTITSFADAAEARDPWFDNALQSHHATKDVLDALNLAYASDGAAIHVAAGTKVEKPLELVWLSTGNANAHYHAHSVVVVEEGANLTLLETRSDTATTPLFATLAMSAIVGDTASLRHVAIYADAKDAVRVAQKRVRLGESTNYNTLSLAVGAGRARTSERVHFAGENASANINGLSLLGNDAVMDNTLFIDHAVPNCQSEETYRYVLDDKSRGVFQGTILVREHAQKIDAQMQARALLMSRKAEMDSKPMLEIYADDVICAHGSAIGEPDQDAIFYLMSRGIDEKAARALLVAGFLDDVVDGFDDGDIGLAIKHLLARRLGAPEETATGLEADV